MTNQPDDQIDKTLAALKAAIPPEGLEARIIQRLAQVPTTTHPPSRWRTPLSTTAPTQAFWCGALTGAAFALLAVTAVLLIQHKTDTSKRITANSPTPATVAIKVSGNAAVPCAQPAIYQPRTLTAPTVETASSSHPIASSPLTTQERELLRLAQTTDPKVLATMNSEHQAQLEAENAAQFDKFFTPPPRPPAPLDPAATPPENPQATPVENPESPQANPEPASADPAANSAVN